MPGPARNDSPNTRLVMSFTVQATLDGEPVTVTWQSGDTLRGDPLAVAKIRLRRT